MPASTERCTCRRLTSEEEPASTIVESRVTPQDSSEEKSVYHSSSGKPNRSRPSAHDFEGILTEIVIRRCPLSRAADLDQLRKEGYPVNEEDKARLSPLIHEHINTQGRHSFSMPEAVAC
jgi:hypothetical protein